MSIRERVFAINKVNYLVYEINSQGFTPSSKKVKAVRDFPLPDSALRSFLGIASSYRKFFSKFAVIACPFNNLLKKNIMFGEQHDRMIENLKEKL